MGMNALTWYVNKASRNVQYWYITNCNCRHHKWKIKACGNATNLILMCFSSCGRVDAIRPEGSRVYQVICNSFSMLALQLKVYYSSLVATFNQFFQCTDSFYMSRHFSEQNAKKRC